MNRNFAGLFVFFLFLASCQSLKVNNAHEGKRGTQAPPAMMPVPQSPSSGGFVSGSDLDRENQNQTGTLPVSSQKPRLALILGPGGLRAYAHAGLLQELAKAKIPVYSVSGLEMGALPAALFALKGQPFEPEWQMMKMKEDDFIHKGLLSGAGSQKADTLAEPLNLMFGSARAEDAKLSFMCSTYSVSKKQTFLLSHGLFTQILTSCLPSLPLFEPSQGNGANPLALLQLAQAARQKGAQLVVYVDLLSENFVSENEQGFFWGLFQQSLDSQVRAASEVVRISGLPGLRAFDRRREMLQKGQEAGKRLIQILQTKYGF